MMKPIFRQVALDEINLDDDTCVVTYRPDMERLQRSVQQVGVLTPLQLRQVSETDRLQIVCGSKRLQASQQAGHTHVPALVYHAEELSEEAALRLALHDNLGCRELNEVEKGRVLWRLRQRYQRPLAELAETLCPLLDLPPREESVDTYCTLVTLDDALQAAMVEGALPLQTVLWIGRQNAGNQRALLALFTGLKLGQNRAREFASLTDEICHRDGCEVEVLWRDLEVAQLLEDDRLSGPQKIERVRHQLRARRYPRLHAHEQQFQDALRRLRLPPQISWQPPPYFDGHQYQVSFRFATDEELRHIAQRLLDAACGPEIEKLLALL
jgi:ParB/RepB/Spo0J family partition protein